MAARLGGKSLRVFIATPPDRHSKAPVPRQPIDAHIDSTLKALRLARGRMLDLGVRVVIENHGDLTARELRALVEAAGADLVGVNYDSGNPMWVMEDPGQALEVLAPYVEVSHFRDSALFEHPRGAAFQWVAMGDGTVGIDGVVARYRELCPGKPVLLEIITGRPPQMLPYLEESWWIGCEKIPASDFARFVNLVKHGHAYLGPMVIGAPGANPGERGGGAARAAAARPGAQPAVLPSEAGARAARRGLGGFLLVLQGGRTLRRRDVLAAAGAEADEVAAADVAAPAVGAEADAQAHPPGGAIVALVPGGEILAHAIRAAGEKDRGQAVAADAELRRAILAARAEAAEQFADDVEDPVRRGGDDAGGTTDRAVSFVAHSGWR